MIEEIIVSQARDSSYQCFSADQGGRVEQATQRQHRGTTARKRSTRDTYSHVLPRDTWLPVNARERRRMHDLKER